VEGYIAVVDRGDCSFFEKAVHAQRAGAVGIVIVNVIDDAPVYMTIPIGEDPATVTITSVSVGKLDGEYIKGAIRDEVFVDGGIGLEAFVHIGRMMHMFGVASHGPSLLDMTPALIEAPVVHASPKEACAEISNCILLKGKIALADRGNCYFHTKVKQLEACGAVAVIILNYDDDIVHMKLPDDQHDNIEIPSVLVGAADANFIKGYISKNHEVEITGQMGTLRQQYHDQPTLQPTPSPTECKEGEVDKTNPCEIKECDGGKWITAVIDCAQAMGIPCEPGYKYGMVKKGKCCAACVRTKNPTPYPTRKPTPSPTKFPTQFPTKKIRTRRPTKERTPFPTRGPTFPTTPPTKRPTRKRTLFPTTRPTAPTAMPTQRPTVMPSSQPTTAVPSSAPTSETLVPKVTDGKIGSGATATTSAPTEKEEESSGVGMMIIVAGGASVLSVLLFIGFKKAKKKAFVNRKRSHIVDASVLASTSHELELASHDSFGTPVATATEVQRTASSEALPMAKPTIVSFDREPSYRLATPQVVSSAAESAVVAVPVDAKQVGIFFVE
jgi:hypothetical protein